MKGLLLSNSSTKPHFVFFDVTCSTCTESVYRSTTRFSAEGVPKRRGVDQAQSIRKVTLARRVFAIGCRIPLNQLCQHVTQNDSQSSQHLRLRFNADTTSCCSAGTTAHKPIHFLMVITAAKKCCHGVQRLDRKLTSCDCNHSDEAPSLHNGNRFSRVVDL